MIFKARTQANSGADTWLWMDQICKAQTYGTLSDGKFINNLNELVDAVKYTWGDERQFDSEIWPDLIVGSLVTSIRLDRENGQQILAMVAGPAFLLSESGDTIERLAG